LAENVASFLIADDHEIVRTGLRKIIETRSGWIVSGEAADGLQAIDLACAKSPDIMIVDYSMPFMNGVEVCRRIRSHGLATQILFLTVHESDDILIEAVSAGARGVLLKSDARKDLITAIMSVCWGRPEVAGARQIDANDQSYLTVGRLPARVLFLRREV
jgi:DNA-binding NarL/FixJ family response regulator